jgi:hypothetical protein
MFELTNVVMQVAESTFATSATDLILAVTALAAAIGSILLGVSGFMKAGKAKDFAISAGQVSQMANQKATESKQRISTGIDAFYNLAPAEQKAQLDNTLPDMKKLTEEIKTGTAQVDRINSIIPEFKAANLAVPREDFETKPSFTVRRVQK